MSRLLEDISLMVIFTPKSQLMVSYLFKTDLGVKTPKLGNSSTVIFIDDVSFA